MHHFADSLHLDNQDRAEAGGTGHRSDRVVASHRAIIDSPSPSALERISVEFLAGSEILFCLRLKDRVSTLLRLHVPT